MLALPISVTLASEAGSFASPHHDPFDRMLAAQSLIENLGLVSVDDTVDVPRCSQDLVDLTRSGEKAKN